MNHLFLYRTIDMMTSILPRRVAYAAAKAVSARAYHNREDARKAVEANLRVVLAARNHPATESDLEQMTQRTFSNFAKYVVDFFQASRLSSRALDRLVQVEHIEYLEACQNLGKGIIGLSAHLGSWELGAYVMQKHGYRINAVVHQQPSANLDALFQSHRMRRHIRVLPMGSGANPLVTCLKRSELVVLLGDLDFSARQRRVPFFGKPARLPRGPAVLAARTAAPILPAFVLREPDDSFRLCLYPPIMPDQFRSIDDIQKRVCSVLEEVIGNHPDQWYAFDPLW